MYPDSSAQCRGHSFFFFFFFFLLLLFFFFFFLELGTEPRALRFLGKGSTTELNPQPLVQTFKYKGRPLIRFFLLVNLYIMFSQPSYFFILLLLLIYSNKNLKINLRNKLDTYLCLLKFLDLHLTCVVSRIGAYDA